MKRAHASGGLLKEKRVCVVHDKAWDQLYDAKSGEHFLLQLRHVESLKYYMKGHPVQVCSMLEKIFIMGLLPLEKTSDVVFYFLEFWYEHLCLDPNFNELTQDADKITLLYDLSWNALVEVASNRTKSRRLGPYLLDAIRYYFKDKSLDIQRDVVSLCDDLCSLEQSEMPPTLWTALGSLWLNELYPFYYHAARKDEMSDINSVIIRVHQAMTAKLLHDELTHIEIILGSLGVILHGDSSALECIKQKFILKDEATFVVLSDRSVSEAVASGVGVVGTVDPVLLGNAKAMEGDQASRLQCMTDMAVQAGYSIQTFDLPGEWRALCDLFLAEAPQVGVIIDRFNAVSVADSIKNALISIHGYEYVYTIILASIAARYHPLAWGDLDVVVSCRSFEVMVQQYYSVLSANALNMQAQFLIGPPGHHCGIKASGFCFTNASVLATLGSGSDEHCVLLGLDINADNGTKEKLGKMLSSTKREKKVCHYDIHDATVFPYEEMQVDIGENYDYYPTDVSKLSDADAVFGVLKAIIESIEAAVVAGERVHLVLSLGWDSSMHDKAFGESTKRFSDGALEFLYQKIKSMQDACTHFRCTILPEGGYDMAVLQRHIKRMLQILGHQPKPLALPSDAGMFAHTGVKHEGAVEVEVSKESVALGSCE